MRLKAEVELEEANKKIASLKLVVSAYNSVADKFIDKVESGQARSRETYAALKTARALARTELES